jgi:nicotinamide-nucleotide amidase
VIDRALAALSATLGEALVQRGWRIATAESCTGGLVAAAITATAGSSSWFDAGFVTYSNAMKVELLGVPQATLDAHGAVSEATARAMAEGALVRSGADLAVSVTGVAGPGGGSASKPVGLVWLAWAQRGGTTTAAAHRFAGDREAVRLASVAVALEGALARSRAVPRA